MVVEGEIIVFRTNKISKADQVKLSRSLYGYVEKSFHNKYAYPRPGALQDIPHIRPLDWRAVLVTKTDDAPRVIELLEEYGAQIYARRIRLEKEDIHRLSRDTDTGTGDDDTGEKAQAQEDQ